MTALAPRECQQCGRIFTGRTCRHRGPERPKAYTNTRPSLRIKTRVGFSRPPQGSLYRDDRSMTLVRQELEQGDRCIILTPAGECRNPRPCPTIGHEKTMKTHGARYE